MRRLLLVAVGIATAAIILGVGRLAAGGEDSAEPEPYVTPQEIRLAVWERSYSECSSYSVRSLAEKYHKQPVPQAVANGVGEAWASVFKGGADAAATGARGCLQAFAERAQGPEG